MGGVKLPKLAESEIRMTGPNVLAATLELKTKGMKLPLLSSAKIAELGDPWLRLISEIRCFCPMGGVHLPVNLLPEIGLIVRNERWILRKLISCSRSTSPTEFPTMPNAR